MSAIFLITFISRRYIKWRKKLPWLSLIFSRKKQINLNYLTDFFVCFDFEENKMPHFSFFGQNWTKIERAACPSNNWYTKLFETLKSENLKNRLNIRQGCK